MRPALVARARSAKRAAAATFAVAAPAGITSFGLVGTWDPADSGTVTTASGIVTALAKSSLDTSSAPTLTNASTGPLIAARADGAGHTRNVLRFTSASSQYLQVASSLGITAGCTLVVISEHASNAVSQIPVDVGAGGSTVGLQRHTLLSSATSGFAHRKCDSSTASAAAVGSVFPTGLHLHVGRSPVAAATAALYNLDGAATSIVGTPVSGIPGSLTHTTVGAARVSNAQVNYFDGWIYRILVYAGPLTDAEAEIIAVWANTNYGTLNLA